MHRKKTFSNFLLALGLGLIIGPLFVIFIMAKSERVYYWIIHLPGPFQFLGSGPYILLFLVSTTFLGIGSIVFSVFLRRRDMKSV